MQPLWAALSALLLCLPGALVHAVVPAPENVRVRCGDQRPVVSWDYSPQESTNFTVRLLGSGRSFTAQTADHELDLSGFVWHSPEQMFSFLYVSVTAEQGPDQSEPRLSPSFSYKQYKSVDISCNLTFPPPNLTVEGAEATLSFENPLHFYKELRTIKHSAEVHLTIIVENQSDQDRQCGPERVCKFSVDIPEDAEPCVNLTGAIAYGAEQILVQHIGPVCATAPTDEFWVVAILSVVLFIFVISLVTYGVCKTRAWVLPKIPTPQSLAPNPSSHRPSTHQSETVYSPIQITGTRPRSIQDPESPSPESQEVQAEDQVLIVPPDLCEYQDESGESTKTETVSLHSSGSEIEVSNYERRAQLIVMDVSGDVVTGYIS